MPKHILTLEDDFNFDLIGICTHQSDYRLCWSINNQLNLQLAKALDPYMVSNKKGEVISSHSLYEWFSETDNLNYYLIQNQSGNKFLIPEKDQIHFFLIIQETGFADVDDIIQQLKLIPSVLLAVSFDPYELKSANRFIF